MAEVEGFPVLIVGTGALACLFGTRLAAQGHAVTFVGRWKAGVEALQRRGVVLVEADGTEHRHSVQATSDPESLPRHRFALVLVKSWQTEDAVRRLRPALAPEGVALTLQNGIGPQEILARGLGAQRVAVGVTTAGATLLGPGRVRAAGQGEVTVARHPRVGPLLQALARAGFPVHVVEDVRAALWGKLLINVAINPFGALLGVPNGALLGDRTAQMFMRKAVDEVVAVTRALDVALPYPDPWEKVLQVLHATATNRNSMLQDLERGAPTEIDALCGAVVRQADALGLDASMNRVLWQMIRKTASSSHKFFMSIA